jgi:sulfur relay (sulfurtransferase) DsrF/TusC family protein
LDQLASFQPKGINFNQVNVFPAVIANSDDADLVRISDGKIVISGQVSESILLQQYVALLKGMNWIKQVRISSYERNQENEGNNFGLIIHVK